MATESNDEALKILLGNGISSLDKDEDTIKIFDSVDTKELSQLMYDHKILITHLSKHERTLEEYYIELLGRSA